MPPSLGKLALVFARYANLTLGGGSATAATIHRELVGKRKWLTEDQFTLSFALGRVTPGTNLLAFCTGFGWIIRGLAGAIVVLLASSIPCATLVAALTALLAYWRDNDLVQAAMHGAIAAAVGITTKTCWTIAHPYFKGRDGPIRVVLIAAAAFCARLVDYPLVHFVGRKLDNPRVKTILQTIVIASAGLLLAAVIPLARDALTDWLTVIIAVLTVVLLLISEIDTLWVVLGSAVASLVASMAGLVHV